MPKIVPKNLLRNQTINIYLRDSEKKQIKKALEVRGVSARDVLLRFITNQGE